MVNRDGRLTGYNTDWLGAVTALTAKVSLKGRHVLILGAGGASRAIAYGIIQAGARVSLTDVDQARATALVKDLGGEAIPLDSRGGLPRHHPGERHPRGHGPGRGRHSHRPGPAGPLRGRHGHRLPAPDKPGCSGKPRRRAAATIDGLQMLIHQATAQFELWTGQEAPAEVMARAAYEALGAKP